LYAFNVSDNVFTPRRGDICALEGLDAIVNSTNEAMTERNDISKRIFAAAGKDLQVKINPALQFQLMLTPLVIGGRFKIGGM